MKRVAAIMMIITLFTGCSALHVKKAKYFVGYSESGYATWYGKEFHGVVTAKKDEKFDMNAMTTAHRTIPFNTMLKVTNKQNGKSIVVRVNDRGPSKEERIVDLSYAAFKKIADPEAGVIPVEIEIIKLEE